MTSSGTGPSEVVDDVVVVVVAAPGVVPPFDAEPELDEEGFANAPVIAISNISINHHFFQNEFNIFVYNN